MKQPILILFLLGICTYTQAQSKSVEALYNKYSSEKDFFHMDLSGSLLGFAEGLDFSLDDAGMGALTKSLEKVKMFKLPVQGELANADFRQLQKGLERERFELMMEVSEKNNGIMMYSKGGNIIRDIVVLISGDEKDAHMVIALEGEFDAQTLAEAGRRALQ